MDIGFLSDFGGKSFNSQEVSEEVGQRSLSFWEMSVIWCQVHLPLAELLTALSNSSELVLLLLKFSGSNMGTCVLSWKGTK